MRVVDIIDDYVATEAEPTEQDRTWDEMCEEADIPTAYQLFHETNLLNSLLILLFGTILFAITFAVFLDCIVFINKHFNIKARRTKTLWILAVYPVYSACALLAVNIPRASTIIDLVADVYLSTCLYQFMGLMLDYVVEPELLLFKLKDVTIQMQSPPLCCCLPCLPEVPVTKKNLAIFRTMVIQLIILRPILSFILAVMWADGVYVPGYIAVDNAYVYSSVINLISSLTAVWGLTLIRRAYYPVLSQHIPEKKFIPLQCVMLLTVIPNLIINMLVNHGVIPCLEVLPSKGRGDRIYHGWLVVLMLPLALIARLFYRRMIDGRVTLQLKTTMSTASFSKGTICASVSPPDNLRCRKCKAKLYSVDTALYNKDTVMPTVMECHEFETTDLEAWNTYM